MGLEPKSLYHVVDTRMNMCEFDDVPEGQRSVLYPDVQKIRANALAVACLMMEDQLVETAGQIALRHNVMNLSDHVKHSYVDNREKQSVFGAPLAGHEKFREEPAPGFGSAFLVKEDEIMTAGHCICNDGNQLKKKNQLDKYRVVFRFHKTDKNQDKKKFECADVYRIKEIISYCYEEDGEDWALIKLDRRVTGIKPIQIDPSINLKVERSVYSMGCPGGTAVKCASVGYATIKGLQTNYIKVDCDTFSGNSGGPLIDRETHTAIGIMTRGPKDYEYEGTGKERVILYRMRASEMILSTAQRINLNMVDYDAHFAKVGRENKILLSNAKSKWFQDCYLAEYRKLKAPNYKPRLDCLAMAQAASSSLTMPDTLKRRIHLMAEFATQQRGKLQEYDAIQALIKEFPDLNLYEAYKLLKSRNKRDNREDLLRKIEIARNEIAYGDIAPNSDDLLYEYEVITFNRRFSPEKIVDVLSYAESRNIRFEEDLMEAILLHIQKRRLNHHQFRLSEEVRFQVVESAWITVCNPSL